MPTISFKVRDDEARRIRRAAQRSRDTISEYVRRRLLEGLPPEETVRRVSCRYTGAKIFRSTEPSSGFGLAEVRDMLRDFP